MCSCVRIFARPLTRGILLMALMLGAGRAQSDDSTERTKEALQVVHAIGLVSYFREDVNGAIDIGRKQNPDYPVEYWDDLKRLSSSEKYLQHAVAILASDLSLEELKTIHAFVGDPIKLTVFRAMVAVPKGVDAKEFQRHVNDLVDKYGPDLVEEARKYGRSLLAKKLQTTLDRIDEQRRDLLTEAIREAQKKRRL